MVERVRFHCGGQRGGGQAVPLRAQVGGGMRRAQADVEVEAVADAANSSSSNDNMCDIAEEQDTESWMC